MKMMISQTAASASSSQSTGNSMPGKAEGGAGFQNVLVQQMNGGASTASKTAEAVQLVANGALSDATGAESAVEPALADLMAMIDSLIEQLQAPSSEEMEAAVEDEQMIKELEAALDQMTALLALLGLPVTIIQHTETSLPTEEGSQSVHAAQTTANLKSSLQDMLMQLEQLLQQGTMKRVHQQEPTVFVAKQLESLTALLAVKPTAAKDASMSEAGEQQQIFTMQTTPQTEVSTLLQRLSQQSVHPSLRSGAASELASDAEASHTGSEPITVGQLTANNGESTKTVAPLLAKPVETTYVVADEFAKSMSGFIVQKLDLSSLNGKSEAKILLFPEQLGQVDVRITLINGIVTASFQTDTAMAKDMLDNQMAQLRAALQAQGLVVDKLEVSQGESTAQLFQHQNGQGNGQQRFTNQSTNGNNGAIEAILEPEMVEQAAAQELGFGRGINVTA